MEQNTPTPEQQVDHSEDILAKARANKKTIVTCIIGAAVLIVAAFIWFFVAQNASSKADELASKADIEQNDSIANELYAQAAKIGYKSGNRAAAELGVRLYREGKYEEAAEYLSKSSLSDDIVAPGVYSLEGDCYVNLEKYDKALSCYKKAISAADKNPQLVPFFLIKEANIYRAQGNYKEEAKAYKTILDDYPQYVASTRTDIRKYYERAKTQAGIE